VAVPSFHRTASSRTRTPDTMKNGTLLLLITLLALAVIGTVFIQFGTGLGYILNDDTEEIAMRIACKARQYHLYEMLTRYKRDRGTVPDELEILVQEGYGTPADLHCPRFSKEGFQHGGSYTYFLDNYGDANSVLLTENWENHSKGLRLKDLQPIVIQTMGDGSIVTKPVDGTIGSKEQN
jgi:hypothetical protein